MKKLVSLVLAMLLVISVVPAMADEGVVTFSYLPFVAAIDVDKNSWAEQYVEANVPGIDVELVLEDWNNTDAMTTMIYGGDMPNFAWLLNSYTPAGLEEQELIRTIPVELFRQYAPSWAKLYDENPIMWASTLDKDDPTQLRALSDFFLQTNSYLWCWFARYDWLEASGIDISDLGIKQVSEDGLLYAAEKGLSKEQTAAFLNYCVNGDPDGNGVNDTLGYLKDYGKLLSGFGIFEGINIDETDGLAKPWYALEKTRDFLAWFRDELYSKGLVYPEIFTIGWGADWDYLTNGLAGLHGSVASNFLGDWAAARPPLTMLAKGIPMVILPGVADDNGDTIRYAGSVAGYQNWLFVSEETTDEQLIAFLRMAEFAYFGNGDDINRAPLMYGEEGVDFIYNEHGVAVSQLTADEAYKKGLNVFTGCIEQGITWEWVNVAPGSYMADIQEYVADKWVGWNVADAKMDLYNETKAASIKSEYGSDWSEVRKAYFQGVITGTKNLDSDWDAYIKALNDSEFDAYLEELNKVAPLQEIINSVSGK